MERRSRFAWLFRWRTLGVFLFLVAILATLVAVVHLIENWRGKRKWEAYRQQLIAQGTKLDLAAFIPPLIPDEQNFAAIPFFDELLPGPMPTNWTRWPTLINNLRVEKAHAMRNERLSDWVAWQKALRAQTGGDTNTLSSDQAAAAQEILAAMHIYEPPLEELRAASKRPLSRYDIRYDMENPWGILLPHLAAIKNVCQTLRVKACAELAVGNTERAMDDIRLMARITDSMETELFLITYLVRIACFQTLLQPVWEGLALDRWSDAQLEQLQQTMLRFNFVAELSTPFAAERAAGILTANILLKQRDKADFLNAIMGAEGPNVIDGALGNFLGSLIPRGWYYMEQFNYTRLFQDFVMPGFDGTKRVVYPAISEHSTARIDQIFRKTRSPILSHNLLAKLCLPAVNKAQRRAAQAQTAAHQAAMACALERYCRAQGNYPAELAQLESQFLKPIPHDVIGGKPMRYKPGKPIVLYSVGWDDKDNGGTPGKVLYDEKGDWVWTYPGAEYK